MINKEEFIKEELSKMLNRIQDEALQDVLKKLLFLQDQNWDNIYDTMVKIMPEIENKFENLLDDVKNASKVVAKLNDNDSPYVGMGATIAYGSDRYPYEVIEVKTAKRLVIRSMNAKRIDNNGLSEDQEYEYSSNPKGSTEIITLRKDNRWKIEKSTKVVRLGNAERYSDPHF